MKKIMQICIAGVLFLGVSFAFASGTAESADGSVTYAQTNKTSAQKQKTALELAKELQTQFVANVDATLAENKLNDAVAFYEEAFNEYKKAFDAKMLDGATVTDASAEDTSNIEKTWQDTLTSTKQKICNFAKNISVQSVNAPKATTVKKDFTSNFVAKLVCTNDAFDLTTCNVRVTYPVANTVGVISYESTVLAVQSDGSVTFAPTKPLFACNDFVTFELYLGEHFIDEDLPKVLMPYKVATNLKASGGSIAIVDYSKAGKVITTDSATSSSVLTALMNRGFTRVGNCDFTQAVTSKNDASVQKEASALFGSSVTYLIYGTVKYLTSEKTDAGYHIVLEGDIRVRNILTNTQLLSFTVRGDATEKSEWNGLNNARKQLAENVADAVLYGMY